MKKLLVPLSIALFTQIPSVNADETNNHFPSLESHDVQTALCNIQTYNEKLTAITNQADLTALDMVKIHELTYTLENAVNFLRVSFKNVSEDLEDVHIASEKLDQDTIKSSGQKYLAVTSLLLHKKQC